jgi:predicted DNA binding CopG/RHH family protein
LLAVFRGRDGRVLAPPTEGTTIIETRKLTAPAEPLPEPGDDDDIIEDLEPEAYGTAFSDGRPIPPGLQAILDEEAAKAAARAAEEAARPPGVSISVRMEYDLLNRLRALARLKGTKYQTLLKTFVAERLYEEERRHGLVGGTRTES